MGTGALAMVMCPGKGLKQGVKVSRGERAWDWVRRTVKMRWEGQ